MAGPILCSRCGEYDSSWLLHARDELTGLDPGTVLGFCAGCWPLQLIEWAAAFVEGSDAEGVTEPAEPAGTDPADMTNAEYYGALEHGDDPTGAGEPEQAEAPKSGRNGKKAPEPEQAETPAEEAEAADVDC